MELTSKVEKMELEARKTADRLAEVGVQKDALERDVATMKTESDRLRCVHRTSVALAQLLVIWLSRTLEGQIENQRALWKYSSAHH